MLAYRIAFVKRIWEAKKPLPVRFCSKSDVKEKVREDRSGGIAGEIVHS